MNEFLVGVFGVFAGWFLNQLSTAASEDAARLSGYIQDIEACSSAVEEYWLAEPDFEGGDRVRSAIVRARFSAVAVFYGEAGELMNQNRLQEYHVLQGRLYRESTGGKFEGKNREIDTERAIEAHTLSRQVVQILRLARKDRLSPWHRFKSIFGF